MIKSRGETLAPYTDIKELLAMRDGEEGEAKSDEGSERICRLLT